MKQTRRASPTPAYVLGRWVELVERSMGNVMMEHVDPETGEVVADGPYKYDPGTANKALENLAKYLGMGETKRADDRMEIKVTLDES